MKRLEAKMTVRAREALSVDSSIGNVTKKLAVLKTS